PAGATQDQVLAYAKQQHQQMSGTDLSKVPTDQLVGMLRQHVQPDAPIIAQSADGVQHQFPAGTDMAVIDRVMKQYAQSKAPQQSDTLGLYKGAAHILDNAASGAKYLANKIPVPGLNEGLGTAVDKFGEALGLSSTEGAVQGHASYIAQKAKQGIVPSNRGELAGEFAASLPIALATPGGALAQGAMTGALSTNARTPGGVAKDAAIGAVAGKVGDKVIGAATRVIAPKVSPYAQRLLDAGVRLTPGQIVGGTARTIEDKATSIPGVGDMIRNARVRGLQDFNTAAINRALAPIGKGVPAGLTGRDAIDHAADTLNQAYTGLLPSLRVNADPQLQTGVRNLTALAKNIPQYGAEPITNFIKQEITPRFSKAGVMTGQSFKEVDSLLRQEAQNYSASGSPNDRKLGQAFWQLRNEFKDALERSNPGAKTKLRAIDTGYANLVRVQNAAARPGADPGVFTPSQLSQAVKASDRSVRKSAVARGNALMQDLSDAGRAVLPSTVPDSGTAGRMLAAALAGGGAAHFVAPVAAAPIAAGMGLYTRAGVKAAEMALARRPAGADYAAKLLSKAKAPTRIAAPVVTVIAADQSP
ncbi:MAG TPA: hypothetical protein VHW69_16360, partial [Rhizomicrobium sp.]|nr:hypothetical protein [Rhizomicrobium sp.]